MRIPTQVKLMMKLHDVETGGSEMDIEENLRRMGKRIDPSLLTFYRKFRKRKKKGVAILQDGICSECRMIYPETHDMLRHGNCLRICEFCGRIIVVTEGAAHDPMASN